jgi:hypothetical protein
MADVRVHQVWETRAMTTEPWRQVKIVNVSLEEVEFQYLSTADASNITTTARTERSAILATTELWRLVDDAPPLQKWGC